MNKSTVFEEYCVIKRIRSIFTHIKIASVAFGLSIFSHCLMVLSDTTDEAAQIELRKEKAQSHFSTAEALFEAGNFEEAAEEFILAYETLPHYTVLSNIGLAYEQAKVYPLAVVYFRRYLAELAAAGKDNAEIEALLQQTLDLVSELVISAEGFDAHSQIHVDGVNKGAPPLTIIVPPGDHDIGVVTNGIRQTVEKLSVAPGETKHLTITPVAPIKPAPVPIAPVPRQILSYKASQSTGLKADTEQKWLGAPFKIATSIAIGGGIVAAVLWGATGNTKTKFDNTENEKEQQKLAQKGTRLQVSAAVTTGVAGAAGLTATIFAIKHMVSQRKNRKKSNNAVSFSASPHGVGIGLRF